MSFLEKAHSVEDQSPPAAKPRRLCEAEVLRCTFANEYLETLQRKVRWRASIRLLTLLG
jgi:hypothetical protein